MNYHELSAEKYKVIGVKAGSRQRRHRKGQAGSAQLIAAGSIGSLRPPDILQPSRPAYNRTGCELQPRPDRGHDRRHQLRRRTQRLRHAGDPGTALPRRRHHLASGAAPVAVVVDYRRRAGAVRAGVRGRQNSRLRPHLERAAHFHSRAHRRPAGLSATARLPLGCSWPQPRWAA